MNYVPKLRHSFKLQMIPNLKAAQKRDKLLHSRNLLQLTRIPQILMSPAKAEALFHFSHGMSLPPK